MSEETQETTVNDSVLANIKVVNDLEEDDPRIPRIKIYIENAVDEIELYLGVDDLDSKLSVAVQKVTQNAITRENYEGTKSVSEEGMSLTFSDTDLEPIQSLLDSYKNSLADNDHRGGVFTFD
ncbi:phage head-tail connector protein [Companilactobacillus keshanensis]|uniref:Phage head-tail connector protein n=1 Tax=Companilactobacillus keshanensis TaxID=2486003 RepID=A0ABW4BV80_9LACO|nr:phage head-tail connector protein [Companilactobacillus keshanensis]